jgi:uncharacterized protein YqjF (DUF2071 family)
MKLSVAAGEWRFVSKRLGTNALLGYHYRPTASLGEAVAGSLDFFLVERYRLFAFRQRGLLSGRVYHAPYWLSAVEITAWSDGLFSLDGFRVPNRPPDHQLYARQLEVSVFAVEQVPGGANFGSKGRWMR